MVLFPGLSAYPFSCHRYSPGLCPVRGNLIKSKFLLAVQITQADLLAEELALQPLLLRDVPHTGKRE